MEEAAAALMSDQEGEDGESRHRAAAKYHEVVQRGQELKRLPETYRQGKVQYLNPWWILWTLFVIQQV